MAEYRGAKRDIIAAIDGKRCRSAWARAVRDSAVDLIDGLDGDDVAADSWQDFERLLLDGAPDWHAYSWGGCALVYDCDIAKHYCTPSELKRTRGGELRPNRCEEWLDVQARGLFQACRLAWRALRMISKEVR